MSSLENLFKTNRKVRKMKFVTKDVYADGHLVGTKYSMQPEDLSCELNGKRYLLLERRGCDFWKEDKSIKGSDVGNYRVFTCFRAKDNGEVVVGDFSKGRRYRYISINKSRATGEHRRLKKPVLIDELALSYDLEYDGYADSIWGKNQYGTYGINPETRWGIPYGDLSYTKEDILKFVNSVADRHYDEVIVVKHPKWDDLGFREKDVLENLVRMEVMQDSNGYLVVRFWHENGQDRFDVEQNTMRITN